MNKHLVDIFLYTDWKWLVPILITIVGLCFTYLASVKSGKISKEVLKNNIYEKANNEWKLKFGACERYLIIEYESLKKQGLTKEDFEDIYKRLHLLHKSKAPENKLFKT